MASQLESTLLTTRFQEGLALAMRAHVRDVRKGTSIPYLAHLLGVCALILADGGDEDEAIAGLLHDTLEDHPESVSRTQLQDLFGGRVLRLIESCTDTPPDYRGGPKPAWRERKLRYLEHIRRARPDELRVSLADKVDNARAILADYRVMGDALWARFSVGQDDQLWYYGALVNAFREANPPGRLLGHLEAHVAELRSLTASGR